MTLKEEILLNDNSISYWLKDAIKSLDKRDIVDAVRDVALLNEIVLEKCKDLKLGALNI